MKHFDFKFISKLCFTFFVSVALLFGCLVLSCTIPNRAIQKNIEKSAYALGKEKPYAFENGDKLNSISDNYADSILLNLSYNMGMGNPLKSAIDTDYYDGETKGLNYGLLYTAQNKNEANTDYTRYWHGSAMFVRLSALFTDISGMRLLGFSVVCFLLLINLGILVYKKRYFVAVSLLISLCCVQLWNLRFSLEYQSSFAVCFALLPFFILLEKNHPNSLYYLFCISGVAVAFFDFLTTETVAILLPLIMVIALGAKEGRAGTFKEIALFSLKCLAVWGVSYVMTFVLKWTLASFVTGENCFSSAFSSVTERFGGEFAGYFDQPKNIFSSVYANFALPFGTEERNNFMLSFLGTLIFLLVAFSVWYLFRSKTPEKNASLVILLLATLVPIRFFGLNNHSFLHCFFTYRALCSAVFAIFTALWLNVGKSKKKR